MNYADIPDRFSSTPRLSVSNAQRLNWTGKARQTEFFIFRL